MKKKPFWGAVGIIVGTTIGAGLLGLPSITGFMGFFPSCLLFVLCWGFFLFSAVCIIDVLASIPGEVNFVTMAQKTLGPWGMALCWIFYLFLLYALMTAYVAGCAPLFMILAKDFFSWDIPLWFAKLLTPLLFGGFVYLGTGKVDWVNRCLMIGLLVSFGILAFVLPSNIVLTNLTHLSWGPFLYAIPVLATSFGFHIVLPSLMTYMKRDTKSLTQAVFLGSGFVLIFYLLWQFLVLGTIPLKGTESLYAAWLKDIPVTIILAKVVNNPLVVTLAYFFSFFAIITSFLGVATSLVDFLRDGLRIKDHWSGRIIASALTFIPPVLISFQYEKAFLLALQYGGVFVAVLLIFLPAAMAWSLKTPRFYKSIKGRICLLVSFLFVACVILVNFLVKWGFFQSMLQNTVDVG